jgi:hypothetical protein
MKPAVRLALLTAAFGLAALAAPPVARAQDAKRAFAEGSHVFRRILFDADCSPLKEFRELADDPAHSILIVLGDTHCLARLPLGVDAFVHRGGAVLLASDRRIADAGIEEQILAVAGVSFTGQTNNAGQPRRTERSCYHGLPYCPYVVPDLVISRIASQLFPDPHGGDRLVATNVPGALARPRNLRPLPGSGSVEVLAHLPPGFGFLSAFAWPGTRETTLFAVGGDVGDGRVLVLADHSVFINEMMLPDDNGNVEFTTNAVNWLRGEGRRNKVLFVEDGRIRDSFEVPLKYETLPLDKAAAAALAWTDQQLERLNRRLGEPGGQAGTDGFLQQWLANRKVPMDYFGDVLVISLTVTLLLYGCYRIGVKGRYRPDLTVPLLARAVQQQAPQRPLMGQRQEALVQSGNLWETAREMARQCFAPMAPPAATPPRVEAAGGWWQRRRTRARVRRLWRLAHSDRPVRVPPRRLKTLLAEIERLKGELRDGTVRLQSAEY